MIDEMSSDIFFSLESKYVNVLAEPIRIIHHLAAVDVPQVSDVIVSSHLLHNSITVAWEAWDRDECWGG